jgi:hypothetical protein
MTEGMLDRVMNVLSGRHRRTECFIDHLFVWFRIIEDQPFRVFVELLVIAFNKGWNEFGPVIGHSNNGYEHEWQSIRGEPCSNLEMSLK